MVEPISSIITVAMGLAKVVPGIIGLFKGKDAEKKAQDVVSIAQSITGIQDPQNAINRIVENPEIAIRFQEAFYNYQVALAQEDTKQLTQVNETMRSEMSSRDPYNSRWRATFGYCVAFSWLFLFIISTYAVVHTVVVNPKQTGMIVSALAELFSGMSTLWIIALSVLGVTVYKRSDDKKTAMGMSSGVTGLLSGVIGRIQK